MGDVRHLFDTGRRPLKGAGDTSVPGSARILDLESLPGILGSIPNGCGEGKERALDLGEILDAALGFPPAEDYILLAADLSVGGIHVYGPYPEDAVHDAAAALREQLVVEGVEGVSVNILALHGPGS
ncbi:hypothetical protein [Actinomycetospora sp. CA-053990]|uniref:hypothetical protein n=1 Tax=Actinomycetospora sp. CA-053990 TaxID=3239891 RepID=UPI003D91812E